VIGPIFYGKETETKTETIVSSQVLVYSDGRFTISGSTTDYYGPVNFNNVTGIKGWNRIHSKSTYASDDTSSTTITSGDPDGKWFIDTDNYNDYYDNYDYYDDDYPGDYNYHGADSDLGYVFD
jgi:hypothetical protein